MLAISFLAGSELINQSLSSSLSLSSLSLSLYCLYKFCCNVLCVFGCAALLHSGYEKQQEVKLGMLEIPSSLCHTTARIQTWVNLDHVLAPLPRTKSFFFFFFPFFSRLNKATPACGFGSNLAVQTNAVGCRQRRASQSGGALLCAAR